MVFSSSIFVLWFLPIFLVIYFICDFKYKNIFALIASVLFYGFGSPTFLLVFIASIVADYFIVARIAKSKTIKTQKIFLTLSLVLNIGLLAYFKYANFFMDNVNSIFSALGLASVEWSSVVLPIGISFFTFQKISYSVDVYRKVSAPLKNICDYALFIMLFPQLIAGPIVRYNEIAGQIIDRRNNDTIDNKILGLYRFIIGLSKKVLIANALGEYVDSIFALPVSEIGCLNSWIGIVAYTFQIYFDFSGYSDMAIGIGQMIGFKFPENFNSPYISCNVSEFWKRWHITLGRWMMDYLYIPLGGNRNGRLRTYFNLWIVFLISGLWHGAAWNFVIWGAYHGFFIVADKIFWKDVCKKIGRVPSVVITFVIVAIGWVLFRADSLGYAFGYIKTMFFLNGNQPVMFMNMHVAVMLVIAAFFSFIGITRFGKAMTDFFFERSSYNVWQYIIVGLVLIVLLIISLSFVLKGSFNPFIYFRF